MTLTSPGASPALRKRLADDLTAIEAAVGRSRHRDKGVWLAAGLAAVAVVVGWVSTRKPEVRADVFLMSGHAAHFAKFGAWTLVALAFAMVAMARPAARVAGLIVMRIAAVAMLLSEWGSDAFWGIGMIGGEGRHAAWRASRTLAMLEPLERLRKRTWLSSNRRLSARLEGVADVIADAQREPRAVWSVVAGVSGLTAAAVALVHWTHVESPEPRVEAIVKAFRSESNETIARLTSPLHSASVQATVERVRAALGDGALGARDNVDGPFRFDEQRRVVATTHVRRGQLESVWTTHGREWLLEDLRFVPHPTLAHSR
jgi:hypothetical protein